MYVIYTTIYPMDEYDGFDDRAILGYCDTYAEAKEIVDNSDYDFIQFKEVTFMRDTDPVYYLCNLRITFNVDDYNIAKLDPNKFHKFIEDIVDKELDSSSITMANMLYIGRNIPYFNTIKFVHYGTKYLLDTNILLTDFNDVEDSRILCANKLKEYINKYTDFSDGNINEFNIQEEKKINANIL